MCVGGSGRNGTILWFYENPRQRDRVLFLALWIFKFLTWSRTDSQEGSGSKSALPDIFAFSLLIRTLLWDVGFGALGSHILSYRKLWLVPFRKRRERYLVQKESLVNRNASLQHRGHHLTQLLVLWVSLLSGLGSSPLSRLLYIFGPHSELPNILQGDGKSSNSVKECRFY